jgi:nitrogen fixation protein FixH
MSIQAMRQFKPVRELKGYHVLIMVIAFFAVIIAINVAFITMAIRSFPGEDVPRSYVQGLQYNETLAARAAQQALGWQATAQLNRNADRVELELSDSAGEPLHRASVQGVLRRPLDARQDRILTFVETHPGRFSADVGAVDQGQWRLRANVLRDGQTFDIEAHLE